MDGMTDDAELQLTAALSGIPLEQAALMQRARRAQGLMGAPMPEGRQVGRVYKAASPLEALAAAVSRYQGGKAMQGVEKGYADLGQRAQQGGLAQMRMERGDKDRAFGLQKQAADRAEMEAMAREADAARDAQHQAAQLAETGRHNRAAESAAQDQYGAIADPVSGGILIFNKKTGQRVGMMPPGGGPPPAPASPSGPLLAPSHPTRPGASAAVGTGGMKEAQRTGARQAGEGSIGMDAAIESGFPANKGLPGLAESAGWAATDKGLTALVPENVEQHAAFWQNAADPIVRARTGAAMPVDEFRKQMTMLLPKPGEAPATHIKKARQMVALFKNATVGLPPQAAEPLLQQLDALEAKLPADVAAYEQMKAGAKGQPTTQRAQGKDGKWYVFRDGGWEAE